MDHTLYEKQELVHINFTYRDIDTAWSELCHLFKRFSIENYLIFPVILHEFQIKQFLWEKCNLQFKIDDGQGRQILTFKLSILAEEKSQEKIV